MSGKGPLANWNGREMPLDEVLVPVTDRAFFFGDGVYEVVRVYGGRPWLLEEHLARLEASLKGILLDCDIERLKQRALVTLDHARDDSAMIYIQVTRGAAKRNHSFPEPPPIPNELINIQELPQDKYASVRQCGVAAVTAKDIRWRRCDIKSINLLPNCLAQESAKRAGAEEALFVGDDGCVTEGTHTNVFGIRDGTLFTAPLSNSILAGVTRRWVLDHAAEAGLAACETAMRADEIHRMSEIFLTGTTTEILGVRAVDGIEIGKGCTGEGTAELLRLLNNDIASLVE